LANPALISLPATFNLPEAVDGQSKACKVADQRGVLAVAGSHCAMGAFQPCTASTDCDRDGLTAAQEDDRGTDPADADTDNDGLSDGAEVNGTLSNTKIISRTGTTTRGLMKTNPLKADTDGDGLKDKAEVVGITVNQKVLRRQGTGRVWVLLTKVFPSPLTRDTDRDGIGDKTEVTGFKTRSGFCRPDPANFNTDFGGRDDRYELLFEDDHPQNPCRLDS